MLFFAQCSNSIHVFSKLERIRVVYKTEENSEIFVGVKILDGECSKIKFSYENVLAHALLLYKS